MPSFLKKLKAGSTKQKQQWLFLGLAVLMFVITLALTAYNFSFLAGKFNAALGTVPQPTVPQGFDIQGFQKLQLVK
ncbi:MAG: hypothetical protein UY51_C0005G0634 [Candidatus Jorgensenbacteria bacterium GW2011_GWB1_49_9]|nr:MAG: hypothetical protein UY51_C0005G0634 [Candidatus Jorgensenbacteria bacterium GW2011_GWB1_49_9]